MEDIHGVDVSWVSSTRDHHHRQISASTPGLANDTHPRRSSNAGHPLPPPHDEGKTAATKTVIPAPEPEPEPATPSPAQKILTKRPSILGRAGSDKPGSVTPPDSRSGSRKNSWISSISSKFSSQNSPAQTTHTQAQGSPANANVVHSPAPSANGALNGIQQAANGNQHTGQGPYVPQQPKASFLSNALRRLSSGGQVGTNGRATPRGGVCPRRVMNIDSGRDRCLVPDLEESKLRRVAFCVDVEIAGGPKYKDEDDPDEKRKKHKETKLKERGEGEALKNPESVANEKDKAGTVSVCEAQENVGTAEEPNPEGTVIDEEKKELTKKREKKKRSEAERKERKEKKRRKAEENGSIPLELTRDAEEKSADGTDTQSKPRPRHQDGPTIDPLRIYRRCCQLRETPILKRISDQLSSPEACALIAPGVVTCLDLTGSRLQLADVVTLSDWLAVVPVKKLLLEDADLTDEKVRVILAGLLAVKAPKKQTSTLVGAKEERSGVVKKLVLKNNPKITTEGWKHIALFIYMCKSILGLDISKIPFPVSETPNTGKTPSDVTEIISKAIAERLGGSCLEELLMSECGLSSTAVRKIIDGCIISGVQRMGLAGNHFNGEGLDHVIHYIKSGVCHGLDLSGTALNDSIPKLTACFTKNSPIWALSLADCGLTQESIRKLFPALTNLPNFRFLDLSHNKDLFSHQSTLCLLRKYMPQFTELRRIHLTDVSLTPAEVIGLAEVLPECAHLAHVDMLENPQLSALAAAMDEEAQEEAAAMYTSLTMAAKVSRTLICVNVDVPAAESNEVVKALAKQVVAYCLRNMENYSDIPELKEAELRDEEREVELPDVLMHLVGQLSSTEIPDNESSPPNEDYIVGGIGMAKALSYCLSQKATDTRRRSVLASGTATPRSTRGEDLQEVGKARAMSTNLLEYARRIRARLHPAMVRVAREGSDISYRRLFTLDQTLQGIIQRFEDEYPETRLHDAVSTNSSVPSTSPPASLVPTSSTLTENGPDSDEDEPSKLARPPYSSDVNLASRAQMLEEGRVHRIGHRVRTELYNPSRPTSSSSQQANLSGTMDEYNLPPHMLALRNYFYRYTGAELKEMSEGAGWDHVFDRIAENAKELKQMEADSPEDFAKFKETQIAALKNRNTDCGIEDHQQRQGNDFAVV